MIGTFLRIIHHAIFVNALKFYFFLNFYVKSKIFRIDVHNVRSYMINGVIYVRNRGKISIGQGFDVNSGVNNNPIGGDTISRFIAATENSVITIGDNVGMSNSTIYSRQSIQIGNNVLIGGGCKIWDTDFHTIDSNNRIFNGDNQIKSAPVVIDDNVFLGAFSIILKGVRIGQNSIIGAGSVVTKDIPANVIAAGNPCKVIRRL